MRLWRGLSAEDRDFVLDIALFDRLDPDRIDEVTGAPNAGRRIASMRALAGLLSTTGGGGSAMRLHPLIKGYCEKRRFEETPERFRALHRDIARALARRGRVVEALRHAAEAGDTAMLGRIAESTGGVRLWLEQGLEGLGTVDGVLTPEVLSEYPLLALVRCVGSPRPSGAGSWAGSCGGPGARRGAVVGRPKRPVARCRSGAAGPPAGVGLGCLPPSTAGCVPPT